MLAITDEDKDLIQDLNGRDPLGVMTVWQRRARDLVPALSAASNRAEGFQLLLVALAWWPEFARRHERRANELPAYFLLVEQAFARATRFAGEGPGWPLPGTRRLNAGDAGLWIGKKQDHFLLDSPLGNGTWGIYRSPAIAAGLLDEQLGVDANHARELMRATPVMSRFFARLDEALSSGERVTLARRRDNQLVADLLAVLVELPSRRFLRARLVEPGTSTLTGGLARLATRQPHEFARDRFLATAVGELRGHAATITQVLSCERLLASYEQIFEFACSAETLRTLDGLAAALPVDLDALARARADFEHCGAFDGLSARRADELRAIDVSSKASLLRGLLALHAAVSESRGSAPWITLSSGVRLERAVVLPQPAAPAIEPATAWRNDYYLGALASLARQL